MSKLVNKKSLLLILLIIADIILIIPGDFSANDGVKMTDNSQELSPEYLTRQNLFTGMDSVFVSFMNKWNIKGASIALAKKGKLVFSKGYGYANKEAGIETRSNHLFRIASVSKLITASAIMKLYENGQIRLNQQVFGADGIFNDSIYLNIKDSRIRKINIHHLLSHSAGWSVYDPDPMFNHIYLSQKLDTSLPLNIESIMRYVLQQPLDFDPGTKSSYSNFGYAVLGKIIEKVSGESYENYVKKHILYPLGIYDMQLGGTYYSQRYPNEVSYYPGKNSYKVLAVDGSGRLVEKPYGGNNMKTLAAAGGWIASAPDLVKFLLAIDGSSSKKDILKPETIQLMTQHDKKIFPYGWRGTHKGFWWRTGTLSGTSTLAVKDNDQTIWIALFNTSTHCASRFPKYVNRTMNQMIDDLAYWPTYDLFQPLTTKFKNPLLSKN